MVGYNSHYQRCLDKALYKLTIHFFWQGSIQTPEIVSRLLDDSPVKTSPVIRNYNFRVVKICPFIGCWLAYIIQWHKFLTYLDFFREYVNNVKQYKHNIHQTMRI